MKQCSTLIIRHTSSICQEWRERIITYKESDTVIIRHTSSICQEWRERIITYKECDTVINRHTSSICQERRILTYIESDTVIIRHILSSIYVCHAARERTITIKFSSSVHKQGNWTFVVQKVIWGKAQYRIWNPL